MKAELLYRLRDFTPEGHLIEAVVWKVPNPVKPSQHLFKYRLVFIMNGERVVGFDNERGKGDHCHLDGKEQSYRFTTIRQLMADFEAEIEKRRGS
jgi:hypothetical protein